MVIRTGYVIASLLQYDAPVVVSFRIS
jgi:hypothetical protein